MKKVVILRETCLMFIFLEQQLEDLQVNQFGFQLFFFFDSQPTHEVDGSFDGLDRPLPFIVGKVAQALFVLYFNVGLIGRTCLDAQR